MLTFFEGHGWECAGMDSNTTTRSAPPKHIAQQRGPGARGSAARARAQEAAASLRSTAVLSPMGIELGPDTLLGMRLVLLKLGDGPLSEFGQKVLIALLIAYSACTIKQS